MSRCLSLAFYMPDLGGGGVERMKINLAAVLLRQGCEVTFVLHRAEGALLPMLPPGARIHSLEAGRTLAALRPLARFLRRERPEVMLCSMGHNNIMALWARRLAGGNCKVVVSQHNAMSSESAAMGNWQHRALPVLCRMFFGWADAIVAVSQGVADDMAAVTGIARERIRVIYNPVVDAGFDDRAGEEPDHPWLAPGQPPVFVGMGRLTPQKDFPTLIRAFARLPDSLGARLLILGEGPLRAELEALICALGLGGRAALAGFQANPLPYLRRSAAFVLSSRYEGFGNVIVEALACGAPVVSTDCPYGPAEILENGRFGRLTPVGDPEALAAAMTAALAEPPPRGLLRARSRDFAVEAIAGKYLDLFSSLR